MPDLRSTVGRRALLGAAVGAPLALLVGCTGAAGEGTNQNGYVSGDGSITRIAPDRRQPAPTITGENLTGEGTITSADHAGKVIVYNVWGSWCPPCRKEIPDLVAVSKGKAEVAQFIGINTKDYAPDPARAFVRSAKVPYPNIYDPAGAQLLLFADFLPPQAIPSTLLVDQQGRVAARVLGEIGRISLGNLIDDIVQGR